VCVCVYIRVNAMQFVILNGTQFT